MYDLKDKTWRHGPSLNQARYSHTSCAIRNRVYLFGGVNNDQKTVKDVEFLEIGSPHQMWKVVSGLTWNGSNPLVSPLNNNEIFFIKSDKAEAFDIDRETVMVVKSNITPRISAFGPSHLVKSGEIIALVIEWESTNNLKLINFTFHNRIASLTTIAEFGP